MRRLPALIVAIAALMIALVTVVTLLVRIPIPATQGYFNFSDVVIYFVSFTFGPWIGFIAGGLGTAIADLVSGFAVFAPISFLAHGLQGLLAGLLGRGRGWQGLLLGWLAGTLAMVGIYFLAELFLYGIGAAAAEVPANLLQNLGGGLIGIPLFYAVRRAYPRITQLGQGRTWREE